MISFLRNIEYRLSRKLPDPIVLLINKFNKSSLKSRQYFKISLHVVMWSLSITFTSTQLDRVWHRVYQGTSIGSMEGEYFTIIMHSIAVLASFYWFGYYVIPRFFDKDKFGKFLLHFILYWIILTLQTHFVFEMLDLYFRPNPVYIELRLPLFRRLYKIETFLNYWFSLEIILFIWAHNFSYVIIPLLLKLVINQYRRGKLMLQISEEKAQMEISFLKNQINPHFLFNTFNNLYSLIKNKEDAAIIVLDNLTKLLRYTLYDTDSDYTLLTKEITFLEDYIHLENIRFAGEPDIKINIKPFVEGVAIPPMILITFVENAIKHGLNPNLGMGFIDISMETYKNHLQFIIINSYTKNNSKKNDYGGIGLQNIRKRLDLIFPDQYMLRVTQDSSTYSVNLTLPYKILPVTNELYDEVDYSRNSL